MALSVVTKPTNIDDSANNNSRFMPCDQLTTISIVNLYDFVGRYNWLSHYSAGNFIVKSLRYHYALSDNSI